LEPKSPREGEDFYDGIILDASRTYELDFCLIKAIIRAESNFNPTAVSPKGACGLMQLMPSTAKDLGVQDVFNPEENIHAGTRYLKWLYETFEGDWPKAIAAYNAGPGRVGFQGIPYIPETHEYLRRVSDFYRIYQEMSGLRVVSK
jgi:soluble lytic murein transglycosylase-like protein